VRTRRKKKAYEEGYFFLTRVAQARTRFLSLDLSVALRLLRIWVSGPMGDFAGIHVSTFAPCSFVQARICFTICLCISPDLPSDLGGYRNYSVKLSAITGVNEASPLLGLRDIWDFGRTIQNFDEGRKRLGGGRANRRYGHIFP
jgi:hypothetical protein